MNPAPNLVLIGPMGAGKSVIGRRLAERYGLAFVDLDREIETRAGRGIPELFATEGEAGFRRREREALVDVTAGTDQVIATGGGAILDAGNRARLRERGFVVLLTLDVEQQLERLAQDRSRPLLAVEDRAAVLTRLAAERGPLYAGTADLTFSTAGMTPADACATLVRQLRAHWRQDDATTDPRPSDDRSLQAPPA